MTLEEFKKTMKEEGYSELIFEILTDEQKTLLFKKVMSDKIYDYVMHYCLNQKPTLEQYKKVVNLYGDSCSFLMDIYYELNPPKEIITILKKKLEKIQKKLSECLTLMEKDLI